jgi:DNA adenine methylase
MLKASMLMSQRKRRIVMSKCYEIDQNGSPEASLGCPTAGSVRITHTANQGIFDVAGEAVATVQERLADAFNIPIQAFGYINGKIVGEQFRLRANDDLVFSLPDGQKGANDRSDGSGFERVKTPFPYIGGKTRVAPEIWRRFGDVKNYVEPFFGGGAVLLNRPGLGSNRIETVNDIDSLLANFWRSLKLHPRKLANVADYPVSELDLHARHSWLMNRREEIAEKMRADEGWCDPKVAAWWVWGISQWIGGGWCQVVSHRRPSMEGRGLFRQRPDLADGGHGIHRRTKASGVVGNRGQLLQEQFKQLAVRLERVRILNGDWSRLVTPAVTTRHGMTGVFLDPPYTEESGRKKGLYAKDDLTVGHQVRDWAVKNGDNPKFRIALCGYESEYRMPLNWSVFDWKAVGSQNGNKERIWFSPHCQK